MYYKLISTKNLILRSVQNFSNQLSYVKGKPFLNPVNASAGEVLLKMTEKNPNKTALYCF